jgi:hypothetical protein
MSLFARKRLASSRHLTCKPQLEVLEGRALPSVAGAVQSLGNAIGDIGRFVADENLAINPFADPQIRQQAQQKANQDLSQFFSDMGNFFNNLLSPFTLPTSSSSSSSTQHPPPPPPVPGARSLGGDFAGSFSSTGADDGRGFFTSGLSGKATMTLTPSARGGFDIVGFVNLVQARPDPAGIDNFGVGLVGFSFHLSSLSQQASFTAGPLNCVGAFSSGGFSGFWSLIEPDGDTSDSGQGLISLKYQ